MRVCWIGLMLALSLPLAAQGAASVPAPSTIVPLTLVADAGNATAQEIADWAIVDAAQKDFGAGNYARLAPHLPALREVMARAPASFPTNLLMGSTLVLHTTTPIICPRLESGQATISFTEGTTPSFEKVRCAPNIYPLAALMLGLYGVEMRMPDQALTALDQGLKLQPGNTDLASEKFAALLMLKRFDEVLSFSDPWIARPNLPANFRGLMLRDRGYALIELNRLDEAKAAYQAALVAQPGHAGALNELRYIAQRQAGGPSAPSVFTSVGKAATVGMEGAKPVP